MFKFSEYDEKEECLVKEYQGYTIEQYDKQDNRWNNAMMEYYPCEIKEMELEGSFDGKI